jgi:hypothetical protein
MRSKSLFYFSAFILAVMVAVVWCAEVYDLVSDGKLPVRRIINSPDSPSNTLLILESGEKLSVTRCIDYKSDIVIEVVVSENVQGYVSEGAFHLERTRWPLKTIFTAPQKLVWTCGPFFNNRKVES